MSPISFGLDLPASLTPEGPVALARAAEDLGFDFVSASDHPAGTDPSYETWTMLAFVAAGTGRIGIATRVLGVPYRPPAMVAKMAETLDRLSGGRLVLGLGGGASDDEFRQLGLHVPTPREKVVGLEEAVAVIRGLWSQKDFTYTGTLFRTENATVEPKPERRIPIWFGTFGPRALELTGRVADGWIPSLGYAPAEELPRMRRRVLDAAERAGRDPSTITTALNLDLDDGLDRLEDLIAQGFTTLNFKVAPGPDRAERIERLATEVLPPLRG
ncbi:LLM class F420-dependent oxidoreductase [Virgisporangium ochraceum]|uniref:LLM class F420-dependent oxidoreductase n=1 Tax=Virgisporangium ochraceum TaxID=65505 RepID=A0A8J4EEN6_9ACTN|nr:LLM class flavin-dependent oxidoreductase [Virgisporangium ochraceum]GIJ71921.1 LLM class F420-dependent oxidoreductase [Virgisporangium ochraceum]